MMRLKGIDYTGVAIFSFCMGFLALIGFIAWLAVGQMRNAQIEACELSIRTMEQHVYVRDARASEQELLINFLIEEHNNLIEEINGNDEQP